MAENQWSTDHRLADDGVFWFGTGYDFGIKYDSANNRLEFLNSSGGNVAGFIEDSVDRLRFDFIVATDEITVNGLKVGLDALVEIGPGDSPYSIGSKDYVIDADTTTGTIQVNLPAVGSAGRRMLWVKDAEGQTAANNVTVNPASSSETIDGSTGYTLNQAYASVGLYNDGAKWYTLGV